MARTEVTPTAAWTQIGVTGLLLLTVAKVGKGNLYLNESATNTAQEVLSRSDLKVQLRQFSETEDTFVRVDTEGEFIVILDQ